MDLGGKTRDKEKKGLREDAFGTVSQAEAEIGTGKRSHREKSKIRKGGEGAFQNHAIGSSRFKESPPAQSKVKGNLGSRKEQRR